VTPARPALRALSGRVGRRGAALLILAALFALYGLSLVYSAEPAPTLRFLDRLMPLRLWGYIWVAAAVIAAVQAFTSARDRPLAFASLNAVSFGWTAGLLAGWIIDDVERGWLGPAIFGSLAALTVVIAGWREEPSR